MKINDLSGTQTILRVIISDKHTGLTLKTAFRIVGYHALGQWLLDNLQHGQTARIERVPS